MRRHTQQTIAATVILLVCGTALLLLSRRWGVGSDLASQLAAAAGPVGVVLGVGVAIHGRGMPPSGITTVTRAWGLVGSAAALVNLWTLGYFAMGGAAGRVARWLLPVALVGGWLLPARAYGSRPDEAGEEVR